MSTVSSSLSMARSLAVLGAVLVVVAALSRAERLPRNWLVGIRMPSTMRSRSAWRAGHRAASGPMAIGGWIDIACAAVLWVLADRQNATPVLATVAVVSTLVAVGVAEVRARRAALEATESEAAPPDAAA